MVSGMTYDVPEVEAMVEQPERDVYCANKQFYDVRNCDHMKTR